MLKRTICTLIQTAIGLAIFLLLLLQFFIMPMLANEYAFIFPEVAYLERPMLILFNLSLVGIQFFATMIAILLQKVKRNTIFEPHSYKYVYTMIGTCFMSGAVWLGITVYLSFFLHANPPLVALGLISGVLISFTLSLLLWVMKQLLQQAIVTL